MYKTIGIIEVSYLHHGNWEDLANILLQNGYTLEFELCEPLPFASDTGRLQISIKEKINESEV